MLGSSYVREVTISINKMLKTVEWVAFSKYPFNRNDDPVYQGTLNTGKITLCLQG